MFSPVIEDRTEKNRKIEWILHYVRVPEGSKQNKTCQNFPAFPNAFVGSFFGSQTLNPEPWNLCTSASFRDSLRVAKNTLNPINPEL